MSPAPCAVVAARDPALADRMWSTVEVDGEETVDPDARRPDLPPDLRPMPDPVGGAVQGTLFD